MRKIIHVDMDCFYAAIEQRDDPGLKGMPVSVGGTPDSRGVVAACNYEARLYGVHSAMACSQARRLCPELVFLKPRMDVYRQESINIRKIFYEYSELIEPLSLDEAYIDVSDCHLHQGSATYIAQAIRLRIFHKTKLKASAGIAPNKFLAKIASDWNKPDGQFVIRPEDVDSFVRRLPVKRIFGVGRVTARKLADMGINICEDLRQFSSIELSQQFGKFGKRLHELSRGIDERDVVSDGIRKSISVENTFENDIDTVDSCIDKLPRLLEELNTRIGKNNSHGLVRKLVIKMKFSDFKTTSVERNSPCTDLNLLERLLIEAWGRNPRAVRLLGVGVRLKETETISADMQQLELELKKKSLTL
jgi:DNA polymerase-4